MDKKTILAIFIFLISGCSSIRHAVPADLLGSVTVFGMRDIRALSGSPSDSFKNDFIKLLEKENSKKNSLFDFTGKKAFYTLAISGGAADGAYGAGLLSGWSESGTRPIFRIVTGVSTGAIIAPIAFLGSKYDYRLREFYTKYSTKDIVRIRVPFVNSFADTRPLERLIEKYFDEKLLKEIAEEYGKGRRLYVGTTNLDAQRLVIWDMGKIASIGTDEALKLFRKIILASASIPIAFPPVYLDVVVNDSKYDEMHVDGGITRQVFFLYDVLEGFDKALKEHGVEVSGIKHGIYIIRNGYVDPLYEEVPDKLPDIAERAVETMTNAQGIGDLYQLYVFTKEHGGDFNLAYIPGSHVSKAKELFDPNEMKELFELGFRQAEKGYPWKKTPPGFQEDR